MNFPIELPAASLKMAEEVGLKPEDVDESFVRGSGPGGQKINKTASAVQLIHRPTGIEVKIQRYREQSKNRLVAWKTLLLKLEEKVKGAESKIQREIYKIKKQKQRRSRRAKDKMLVDKKLRGTVKEGRREAWDQFRDLI